MHLVYLPTQTNRVLPFYLPMYGSAELKTDDFIHKVCSILKSMLKCLVSCTRIYSNLSRGFDWEKIQTLFLSIERKVPPTSEEVDPVPRP